MNKRNNKLKEIVVVSGKGGTGKTTVTACLSGIMKEKIVVDADVDAANLHLLLRPRNIRGYDFEGKPAARIDPAKCTECGRCRVMCRFEAVNLEDGVYRVDDFSCEGCGLCKLVCPAGAVEMLPRTVGKWFTAETGDGDFVYARLNPGGENSGGLVARVRQQARDKAEEKGIGTLLIDGPPGIGCPVTSAVTGADLAVIVTEPSNSAISDLRRIAELLRHFKVKAGMVINRFDINRDNTRRIETLAEEMGLGIYAKIPHNKCIMREISTGRVPSGKCKTLAAAVEKIYGHIKQELNLNENMDLN